MMDRTYFTAEQVAVWLGSSDRDPPMLWSFFLDLTNLLDFAKTEVYDLGLRSKSPIPSWAIFEVHVNAKVQYLALHDAPMKLADLPPAVDPLWRVVRRFLERP